MEVSTKPWNKSAINFHQRKVIQDRSAHSSTFSSQYFVPCFFFLTSGPFLPKVSLLCITGVSSSHCTLPLPFDLLPMRFDSLYRELPFCMTSSVFCRFFVSSNTTNSTQKHTSSSPFLCGVGQTQADSRRKMHDRVLTTQACTIFQSKSRVETTAHMRADRIDKNHDSLRFRIVVESIPGGLMTKSLACR